MKIKISSIISAVLLVCSGIKADLTEKQKDTLLLLHQEARNVVNAPDMKELHWDKTLAEAAQNYSNKCLGMVHSNEGPENLAGNTSGDITKMFNQWTKEKDAFDQSGYRANFKSSSYNGVVIGHYSQIVWANNSKVGCGFTYCENYKYKYLLVCRYETGNILTRQVYAEPIKSTTTKKSTTTTTVKKTTTTTKKTTTTTTVKKTTTTTTSKKPTTTTTKKTTTTTKKTTTTTKKTTTTTKKTTTTTKKTTTTTKKTTTTTKKTTTTTKKTTTTTKKTTTTTKKTTTTTKKTTTTTKKTTTTTKKTTTTTKTSSTSTNGRCGAGYGICPSSQCCSKSGYCGTSANHCALVKGCQSSYGKCKNIKFVTVIKSS